MRSYYAQTAYTKFHGPTDTKGARVSVTCNGTRKVYPLDYSTRDIHAWAFERFVQDFKLPLTEYFESEAKHGRVFTFRSSGGES